MGNAAEGEVTKSGIPAKARAEITKVITDDPIALACSKVGCKKKDIDDAMTKSQEAVAQVKATVYANAAKVYALLSDFASQAVATFEAHVPSHKDVLPKTFEDLLLVTIYACLVFYVVLRIALFVFKTALSIFC